MAGNCLRGAFVQFMETFLIPAPNVISFQFNPENIVHSWTPAQTASEYGNDNPLAVSGTPGETFEFTLQMDSSEMIAEGGPTAEALAMTTGIYTRLAALEMLMQPVTSPSGSLLGSVSAGGSGGGGDERKVPASQLPVVLFVWGPGRILPIKVSSLSITEILYDSSRLHPIHAQARVNVEVLTPKELQYVGGPLAKIARSAYTYSQGLRETLAIANLANAAESAIGVLPI